MTYLLFSGCDQFPAGGAEDFAGVFPSIELAKAYFAEHQEEWAHIAVFADNRLTIVCAYSSWEPTQAGVATWHDCKDVEQPSSREHLGKELRYHTCGQAVWFSEELSGPAYYHDQGFGNSIYVSHCPRCRKALTPGTLQKGPKQPG